MTACDLKNPIFNDEDKAREALEAVRWPNGPFCPHCGSVEGLAKVEGKKRSHRPGLFYCNACKGQFTVTVGTVFERSKIPLTKWWLAVYMLASSKKGISTHQLHRVRGVTYKTAWFMTHRIREAMRSGELAPMGGAGGSGRVEADETYFGKYDEPRERMKKRYYPVTKGGRWSRRQARHPYLGRARRQRSPLPLDHARQGDGREDRARQHRQGSHSLHG